MIENSNKSVDWTKVIEETVDMWSKEHKGEFELNLY